MAPSLFESFLARRQTFNDNDDNGGNDDFCDPNTGYGCRSNWDTWGRWVALVVIILFFIIIAFCFSALANRRRRRLGHSPILGTGWVPYVGHQGFQQPPPYGQPRYNPDEAYPAPPPKYDGQVNAQETGSTFTGNPGYYGNHDNIELQQPSNVYHQAERGDSYVYAPPEGPPPAKDEKTDGVIR